MSARPERRLTDPHYRVVRKPRLKNTAIIIHPDNRIEVRAPHHVSDEQIASFVAEKGNWIRKKIAFNRRRTPYQPKTFHHDEPFLLRGKRLRLRVKQADAPSIEATEGRLRVTHPEPAPEQLKQLIGAWYVATAECHFQQRARALAGIVGRHPASVGVKGYRSRWGSCHRDGRIYFNWRLIMAPDAVIDDIIIHELCHLLEPNHSAAFWQLVKQCTATHQESKNWLKLHGLSLDL